MGKVIVIKQDKVYVLPNVDTQFQDQIMKNRVYDTYTGSTKFSKEVRRQLLQLEIDRLRKELYLVDEG